MPGPNESDRERLLRLIDGGPEIVKEVQEERQPIVEEKKTVVVDKKIVPGPFEKLLGRIRLDARRITKIILGFILLILMLRFASDFLKSFGKSEKVSSPVAVGHPGGVSDDVGTGLRLVGVDWGEPPVALLEDLKTGKTYFARKDEKIKETRVKQIFKDKVVVVFHGKTLELR